MINHSKSELESKYLELLKKPTRTKEEIDEKERLRARLTEELKQEIKQLSQELSKAGSKYADPWDMVNTKESYPEAIKILIEHLPKNYHPRNKEGIVRALTVKEARGKANIALIKEYDGIPKEYYSLRWAIGNAFYVIITKDDVDNIIPIILNKKNGASRSRFVEALGKVRSEKTENALIELLEDDEVLLPALRALGRMKSVKAKKKIVLLTNSQDSMIRKEALKALRKL